MTFALYLFHLPLLYLIADFIPADVPVPVRGLIEGGLVLAIVYLLSFVTEGQKRRWRSAIRWLLRPFGAPETKESAA
jgi:peptidoglycan/LPS O-acetylase OafA/YrhL